MKTFIIAAAAVLAAGAASAQPAPGTPPPPTPETRPTPPPPRPGGPRGAAIKIERGDISISVRCAEGESTRTCGEIVSALVEKMTERPQRAGGERRMRDGEGERPRGDFRDRDDRRDRDRE